MDAAPNISGHSTLNLAGLLLQIPIRSPLLVIRERGSHFINQLPIVSPGHRQRLLLVLDSIVKFPRLGLCRSQRPDTIGLQAFKASSKAFAPSRTPAAGQVAYNHAKLL